MPIILSSPDGTVLDVIPPSLIGGRRIIARRILSQPRAFIPTMAPLGILDTHADRVLDTGIQAFMDVVLRIEPRDGLPTRAGL